MPQAVAVWAANAVMAVTASAAAVTGVSAIASAGIAIGTGIVALSGALGVGAAVSAWATVGLLAMSTSRPKIPQSSGGQISLKMDPQAPIPIVLGRTATAGYMIYRAGFGNKNQHLGIISVLSTGPIQAFESFFANDIPCTFTNTSAGPTTVSGQWANKMRLYRLLGNDSDTAYDLPVPPYQAELPGWTSAHKTTGYATALWVNQFDTGRYPTGLPRPLHVLQGELFYDPRFDSTYPGGSGPQRLNNPATWTFTENSYIMAIGWLLGRFRNGKKIWGCGVAVSGIDLQSFIDGANVADANVWKSGGVVTTADDKWSVLTTILQAGGGMPIARGGQVSCLVSSPKASVYTITSSDVVGDISIQTPLPRRNRVNTVVPKYRSEANRWEMIVGSPVTNATYLAEDLSEPRSKEFELPLVQQVNQAAQLAAYELCSAREGLTITLTCKPRLLNVRVGEAASVTLNEIGLVNQKCIVSARSFDPITLQVSVTLRSETDAKHDFALGRTGIAPPSPSLTRYDPSTIAAPSVGVWVATGGTIANNNVTQPAILIAGATDDENAQSVIIEYRPASSATYRLWTEGPASSTNFEITAVSENTSYVVAVSYRSIRGVVGARRELAAVTTGSLSAGLIGGLGPDEVQNALVAAGTGNRVVLSRFEKGTVNWFGFGTASNVALGTSLSDGLNVSATSEMGQYAAVRSTYFKVRPGEQLAVSALVGTDSNTSTTVFIGYQDVSGNNLSGTTNTQIGATVPASTFIALREGMVTVPANAAQATIFFFCLPQVSGFITSSIFQPMVQGVPLGQLVFPSFTPGPNAVPGADVTAANIAAGFTGQGALATLNQAAWATQVTGIGKPEDYATLSRVYRQATAPTAPGLNDIWIVLDGFANAIAVRAWNGSAWITGGDLTAVNIAAAITGQTAVTTAPAPSFAGNAAALAGGVAVGQFFTDTTDGNKVKAVVPPGGLFATVSPASLFAQGTVGTITSPSCTVTPSAGAGTVTYQWIAVTNPDNILINSPTSATTVFYRVMAAGQSADAKFLCLVTNTSGQTASVVVSVSLNEIS